MQREDDTRVVLAYAAEAVGEICWSKVRAVPQWIFWQDAMAGQCEPDHKGCQWPTPPADWMFMSNRLSKRVAVWRVSGVG